MIEEFKPDLKSRLLSKPKDEGGTSSSAAGESTAEKEPKLYLKSRLLSKPKDEKQRLVPLTAGLEFGRFGVGVGNIEKDGFEARVSNNDHNQDAIAISHDKDVFVVADGLGGSGAFNPEAVTRWSRAIAEAVAIRGDIKSLPNERVFREFVTDIKQQLESQGVNFMPGRMKGHETGIKTTIAAAERIGQHIFSVLTIGDSPIYIIDKSSGAIVRQFGEDVMKGETDAPLKNDAGTDFNGNVAGLRHPSYIVNETIEVLPGQVIVMGSDFFSDHTAAGRNLKEYIGLSPEQFHEKAISPGHAKQDDASLIVIDPYKLPETKTIWSAETL